MWPTCSRSKHPWQWTTVLPPRLVASSSAARASSDRIFVSDIPLPSAPSRAPSFRPAMRRAERGQAGRRPRIGPTVSPEARGLSAVSHNGSGASRRGPRGCPAWRSGGGYALMPSWLAKM